MLPVIFISVFIFLSGAYYFDQKAKIKREQQRESFREKQEALFEQVRNKQKELKDGDTQQNIFS